MPSDPAESARSRARCLLGGILVYVVLVLGVDSLAALHVRWIIDWDMFRWFPFSGGGFDILWQFDGFKFLFWFALPFACCSPRMDWGALGVKRWKRRDLLALGLLAFAGLAAVGIIPFVPELSALYHRSGSAALPFAAKLHRLGVLLVWDISWLLGWEFLHRYVLLRAADRAYPRFAWLLVPLSETLYHLQKPRLEMLGMLALSLLLTLWARKRKNILLPFLVHLIIELELAAFLLL